MNFSWHTNLPFLGFRFKWRWKRSLRPTALSVLFLRLLRVGINSLSIIFHRMPVFFLFKNKSYRHWHIRYTRRLQQGVSHFSVKMHNFIYWCQDYLKSVATILSRSYRLRGHRLQGKAQVFSKECKPMASFQLLPWEIVEPTWLAFEEKPEI